jgi:hypothetical protein
MDLPRPSPTVTSRHQEGNHVIDDGEQEYGRKKEIKI